eukprot:4839612-Prymnesium_polylepis.1
MTDEACHAQVNVWLLVVYVVHVAERRQLARRGHGRGGTMAVARSRRPRTTVARRVAESQRDTICACALCAGARERGGLAVVSCRAARESSFFSIGSQPKVARNAWSFSPE